MSAEFPQIYIPKPKERFVRPSEEKLVKTAKKELASFFGKDFHVPKPPDELFRTLERFESLGIRGFEPHYLPNYQLREEEELPGWKVKPSKTFWEHLKAGLIEKGADTLKNGWYLVDGRGKPDGRVDDLWNVQHLYNDDYLAPLIESLRDSGRIYVHRRSLPWTPRNSRFDTSPSEIERIILPEFATQTQLEGNVSNMAYMQFNIWGNMTHPEWGRTNTSQWFRDKVRANGRLIGGNSNGGGLANGYHWAEVGARFHSTAFSPVIAYVTLGQHLQYLSFRTYREKSQ